MEKIINFDFILMKRKSVQFVIFGVIFWHIGQTEAQNVRCDYKYNYFWITGYKNTIASYYKCNLDTRQANYGEKLTTIDGQHETGHTDADVEWIGNYKNQKLKSFSTIFCQKFPNLEMIQINDAELESIDEDSLSNCKKFEIFVLI